MSFEKSSFKTSSYSHDDCVAVARGERVAVVDTKNYGSHGTGPVLTLPREAWTAALGLIR